MPSSVLEAVRRNFGLREHADAGRLRHKIGEAQMDGLRESLRTGYTLDGLVRAASAARDGARGGHQIGGEQGDWLADSVLGAARRHDESEKLKELEELKAYIKAHIKAYAVGIQCLLAVVLCLQVVCVVRLFWGQ
jgi:hypothetical protein